MAKKRVILVGSQNLGGEPDDGETMKNHLIGLQLEKLGLTVSRIDLRHRPARCLYLVKYLYELAFHRKARIVMSASSLVASRMLRVARWMGWKGRDIVYWVVGGSFGELVDSKRLRAEDYKDLSRILVQGRSMVKVLNANGLTNVQYLPNSKPIKYLPAKSSVAAGPVRFVFLSRVMPEKGVDYIVEAVRMLKDKGVEDFRVDLYGKVDAAYRDQISAEMQPLPNLAYKGFLKLDTAAGYDTLASYDMMLFPTYWHGEGFPGVILDAFIAGLPVIATAWNLNADLIRDGYNGLLIPVHDARALAEAMEQVIAGKVDLKAMSERVQKDALQYDVDNVITPDLLRAVNIL